MSLKYFNTNVVDVEMINAIAPTKPVALAMVMLFLLMFLFSLDISLLIFSNVS